MVDRARRQQRTFLVGCGLIIAAIVAITVLAWPGGDAHRLAASAHASRTTSTTAAPVTTAALAPAPTTLAPATTTSIAPATKTRPPAPTTRAPAATTTGAPVAAPGSLGGPW